jgi:hypothetical protein
MQFKNTYLIKLQNNLEKIFILIVNENKLKCFINDYSDIPQEVKLSLIVKFSGY